MTTHPIDTEALRARLAPLAWHSTPPITTDHVRRVLDALAAAEHRATRAEAQAEARRVNAVYWRERTGVHEARTAEEKRLRMKATAAATEAEARIKAVRELHQHGGSTFGDGLEDHTPVCADCLEEWPCPTIRALDGSATPPRA